MSRKEYKSEQLQRHLALVKAELDTFASQNGTAATDFAFQDKLFVYESIVPLGDTEIHFWAEEGAALGYRFLEGTEDDLTPALITRFRFPFSPYYFSPYDIHNALELSDFTTLDYHYITDEAAAAYAVQSVLHFIAANRSALEAICRDTALQQKLADSYEHDLKLVSKRITAQKLEKDFLKYTYSHEVDMYYHMDLADGMTAFISQGKTGSLQRQLARRSAKGKLLVFEQRYFDYLMAHSFEAPQGYPYEANRKMHTTQKKSSRVNTVLELIGAVLVLALGAGLNVLSRHVTAGERTVISYTGFLDRSLLLFFLAIVAMTIFLQATAGIAVSKRFHARNVFSAFKPSTRAIVAVICAVLVGVYGVVQWEYGKELAAVSDSGLYLSEAFGKGEELPLHSDRLVFALAEGIVDYNEQPEYSNSIDDKSLYIILDGDFDNAVVTDNYQCDMTALLAYFQEQDVPVDSLYDIQAVEEKYNPDYHPGDWI